MSNEIKCPHCGEAFTVDESGYAAILNQVRDQEFQREVDARVSLAEKSREQEVALAVTKAEEALRAQIAERDGFIEIGAAVTLEKAYAALNTAQSFTRRSSARGSSNRLQLYVWSGRVSMSAVRIFGPLIGLVIWFLVVVVEVRVPAWL